MKNCKELLAENRAWTEEIFKKIDRKMSKVTTRRNPFARTAGLRASGAEPTCFSTKQRRMKII